MDSVFLNVLNLSITASWLILAVILMRFLMKKAPKWLICLMWAVAGLRLVCPVSIESVLSLIPSAKTVTPEILYSRTPAINSGIPALNRAVNPIITDSFAPDPAASVNPLQIWTLIAAYVWMLGIALLLIYAAVSFIRLRRKVRASINVRDNIFICDDISAPFILGIFKPRVYLPSSMDAAVQMHVIAHENAHLARRDHLWKPLGYLILTFYWFNPLCWLAYILLCRDIELACDEKVICTLDKDEMLAYSDALLLCSLPRKLIAVCFLTNLIAHDTKPTLTLSGVVTLSAKGNELTWADFDDYSHIETGSGLYIRVYEIDETFSVIIGGGSTDSAPMYVKLAANFPESDDSVDMRAGDVTAFIEKYKSLSSTAENGGAELTGTVYQTAYSWVNYSEDSYNAMVERAENRDMERRYENISHLTPVVKLDNKSDFERFYSEMSSYFSFTADYDGIPSFEKQAEQYDENFFAENALFITYLTEETDANRHELEDISIENGILDLSICRSEPDVGDAVMAGWFLCVAVPKSAITDCTGYDAYICVTTYPDRQIPSGNLISVYVYNGEDAMHTASVSLYDSGEFFFNFSPISSYIGYGTYTMENDRLTLKTEYSDHPYYVFDITDDGLVFDGDASWANTWYSGVTDGAVFKESYRRDIDRMTADIDNDGIAEDCTLGYGPTTGLFTFTFTATVGGEEKYSNIYNTEWYKLSFTERDGKAYVQGATQGDSPVTHLFAISVKDGNVVLSENGEQLAYWGKPGVEN